MEGETANTHFNTSRQFCWFLSKSDIKLYKIWHKNIFVNDLLIDVLIFTCKLEEPSWSWSYGSWIYNYICNQCLSPLMLWVRIPLRRGVFDTTLCDKVCQWFLPGTPVFSTNTHLLRNKQNKYSKHIRTINFEPVAYSCGGK
jgi:hypothetical protein